MSSSSIRYYTGDRDGVSFDSLCSNIVGVVEPTIIHTQLFSLYTKVLDIDVSDTDDTESVTLS